MPKIAVSESIAINAPPEEVFRLVSDFGRWTEWSPWLCAEPDADVTVSEDPSSVGSTYQWSGDIVGAGEIEHRTLEPGKRIHEELRFFKPWESRADVYFDFERSPEGTNVTWTMDSSLPWFMFWMKKSMEQFIGMDYERGLKMMKELIETGSVASKTNIKGVESVGPINMVGIRKQCGMDEINDAMSYAISETDKALDSQNVQCVGEKLAVYHSFDPAARTFDFTAGVILPEPTSVAGLSDWSLPESKAITVEHRGSYENLGNSWSAAYKYAEHKKLKQGKVATFEIYRNDPSTTSAEELHTDIYLPLR